MLQLALERIFSLGAFQVKLCRFYLRACVMEINIPLPESEKWNEGKY